MLHAKSGKGVAHLTDTALMISTKSVGVLAGLLGLFLWSACVDDRQADWERHIDAGLTAYQQGKFAEAVKQTKAA